MPNQAVRNIPWFKLYVGLLAFSILGTALSQFTGLNPGPIKPVAAVFTILAGFMSVFQPFVNTVGKRKAVTACLLVFVIGISSELIGLYTGFPFGHYRYTDQWAPVISIPGGHFFPLLLPFAWMLIAGGGYFAAASLRRNPDKPAAAGAILFGALFAAVVDLFMEPVMIYRLKYWVWEPSGPLFGAPVMNFVGWVLTSLAAGFVLHAFMGGKTHSKVPGAVLILHLLAMLAIGALMGMSV